MSRTLQYTVWVSGSEKGTYATENEAEQVWSDWSDEGYQDVQIEEHFNDDETPEERRNKMNSNTRGEHRSTIDNLYRFLWESGYSIGEIDHITWGGWDESWGHKKERLNVHTEVDVAYWKDKSIAEEGEV